MVIKININLTNRWLYTLIAVACLLVFSVVVYSSAYVNPTTKVGHDPSEIGPGTFAGPDLTKPESERATDYIFPEGSRICIGGDCITEWPEVLDVAGWTCTDTDGGQDFLVAGTTSKGGASQSDYCRLPTLVTESYCDINQNMVWIEQWCDNLYGEDYSCLDGKCQKTCTSSECPVCNPGYCENCVRKCINGKCACECTRVCI